MGQQTPQRLDQPCARLLRRVRLPGTVAAPPAGGCPRRQSADGRPTGLQRQGRPA